MASEQVLKLLDTYWFETSIFTNNQTSSSLHPTLDSTIPQPHVDELLSLDTKLLRIPTLQVRFFSEENLGSIDAFSDSLSPISVLALKEKKKLLQPILSGKEVEDSKSHEEASDKKKLSHHHCHRTRQRKGKKTSRSFSELEFKELKGFMDLGFVFCEEDKESRLVSLIPGLQMLGRDEEACEIVKEEQHNIDETVICRPYLSEAWGVLDHKKKAVNPLLNWRVPALGSEIDMKDNLKFWAHKVASIGR